MNLFNKKTLERHINDAPLPADHLAALQAWSELILRIHGLKETALHGEFTSKIVEGVLGTAARRTARTTPSRRNRRSCAGASISPSAGSAGVAPEIVAPFELKGADTRDLDAIMPGRSKSPVQQAWEYAMNSRGVKWVLVSNYVELWLYGFGEGTTAYETFRLDRLTDPREYARFMLLLSADNLLSGRTRELLEDSRREDRDITDSVYRDYLPHFEGVKVSYPHFNEARNFSWERTGALSNDKTYMVASDDPTLLALLNSRTIWFVLSSMSPPVRGGYHELRVQYVERRPIPMIPAGAKADLIADALKTQQAAERRLALQRALTRRIPDLCPKGREPKLTTALREWWTLPDFAAFRAEVRKAFKADVPLAERSAWEDWISRDRTEIVRLSAEIAAAEARIDGIVYRLFDLTPDEIALLEASV